MSNLKTTPQKTRGNVKILTLYLTTVWVDNQVREGGSRLEIKAKWLVLEVMKFFFWFMSVFFSFNLCHLLLLVHWPQRYYCKFRRAQCCSAWAASRSSSSSSSRAAAASSIAKPKRNARWGHPIILYDDYETQSMFFETHTHGNPWQKRAREELLQQHSSFLRWWLRLVNNRAGPKKELHAE